MNVHEDAERVAARQDAFWKMVDAESHYVPCVKCSRTTPHLHTGGDILYFGSYVDS